MNLLAYETSSPVFSICLETQNATWHIKEPSPQQHANIILTATANLLFKAGLSLLDINALAYSCGPGSFTGIRIGAAVVHAVALSHHVRLLAIPSLQNLAQGVYRCFAHTQILILLDAKMNEVYYGHYRLSTAGIMEPQEADKLCAFQELDISHLPENVIVVTDLEEANLPVFSHHQIIKKFYPEAIDLMLLMKTKLMDNDQGTLEKALPIYLRQENAWKIAKG